MISRPNSLPGLVTGKVLAANHTGQVYMWTDFNFVAPYHFQYDDFPNDYQRVCYKFDDKRYFSVRFTVSEDVKNHKHEAISETHVSGWTVEDMEVNVSPKNDRCPKASSTCLGQQIRCTDSG